MGRIQDSPPLTRFVIESKKVVTNPADKKLRVKAKLFEPYQRKVSVFLTEGWSDQQRVQRGIHVAWKREKRKLYGWVILRASEVPEKIRDLSDPRNPTELICRLTIEVDNDPPGHANIVGWPDETDDWLAWQEVLAERSDANLFPIEISQ